MVFYFSLIYHFVVTGSAFEEKGNFRIDFLKGALN